MIRMQAEPLRRVVAAVFHRLGSAEAEAATIGRRLVDANLVGHDSHGVVRVPSYAEVVRSGGMLPNRKIKVVTDTPVMAVLDGQAGFGQVIGEQAMDIGIAKAKQQGLAMIALRNSSHLGRIGDWTERCADAGLASIHFVNITGHGSLVAPFGGTDARTSTNPISAGMPRPDGRHVILDMATSKLAEGKVKVAFNKGVPLPEGSLLDAKGKPTRDPRDLYTNPRGALTPMGEHKGYGISVMCELFAGLVTGGGCHHPPNLGKGQILNAMLSFIFNPHPAGNRNAAQAEMEQFIQWVCASPPAEPGKPVLVPGDPERANKAERLRDGVPLDETTWNNIVVTAESLGLTRAEIDRMAKASAA